MNSEIQKAIDCLKIRDVFLRDSISSLAPSFDPKYSEQTEIRVQFKHLVTRGVVVALRENENDIKLFQVYIELGSRWLSLEDLNEKSKKKKKDEDEVDLKAKVEATFVAEYLLEGDPGKEALDAFALNNASYHVWPYWREYLTSQCIRMNLPKLVLPAVQFAKNKEQKDSESSS